MAMTTNRILAIIALLIAVASLFIQTYPLLTVAVMLLAVALLV